eukprot:TRINITY_DN8967_c0_g1_i3.p1 TRINITY_DN8967_c0_g1~~TRINITY_DN8967_c0_g1_i3.p1  ORF type:complete len:296 (-),score=97.88 TRINITY_DN8967_c0_g1_i3:352-1239(-)
MPQYTKCADCGTELTDLMVEGGLMKRGCAVCWAKNNFQGDPPCKDGVAGLQRNTSKLTNKLQVLHRAKSKEEVLEEQRLQLKAKKLEKLKKKDPLKQAFHALIRHVKEKGLSEYELFREIDQDGDGNLTRMEMSAALRHLGVKLLPLELDAVLRVFDADGSGDIDFAEFYKALKEEEQNVEGVLEDGPDPRLCGFVLGQRVRMKCKLFRDLTVQGKSLFDDVSTAAAARVMGPGMKKDLLLVVIDKTGEALNVKANTIEPWEVPLQHDPLCTCSKCFQEFCQLDDEDDDKLPWCS